jgi:hypothetical protein
MSDRFVFQHIFPNLQQDNEDFISILDKTLNNDIVNQEQLMVEKTKETPTQVVDKNEIKTGVPELFDSNPELANAVYEALGFVPKMITREGQEYFNNPRIRFFVKIADEVRASLPKIEDGYTRLYRGNRPSDLKSNPQFTNSLEGIALPFLMSYEGQLSYIDIPTSDLLKYVQKGGVATNAEFIVTPEIAKTATPIDNTIVEKYKEQYPDKFAPVEITPQQKQQAQQLYSQYLEQNPNGSVEQFKSWVDEFNRDNQKLNSNIQIFSDNNNGNFDSSSLKDDDLALMLFNQALGLNLTSANQLTWNNIKDNIFFEKEDGSLGVKNLAFVGGNLLSTKKATLSDFINQKGLFPEYKVFIGESVIYPNVFEVLEENEIIKQAVFENLFNLSGAFEQVKKELNNHSPETFVIGTPHGKFTFPKRFASGFFKIASTVELLLKENQSSYIQECVKGLNHAAGFLRRQLGDALNTRVIPTLIFKEDRGYENTSRVFELLKNEKF